MARAMAVRPGAGRAPWLAAGLLLLLAWSVHGTRVEMGTLLSGESARQIWIYVSGLFPPDLSAPVLRDAARAAVETLAISLVGSLLSVLIAFPLALLGAPRLLFRGRLFEAGSPAPLRRIVGTTLYVAIKALFNVLRTVPEIVWALIFVFLVGLGPFPGVLALAAHTGGVLGKLFGEVLEDVDERPLEALQSTGASRARILIYGIVPQAMPQFLAYALYRWEVNIRAAAIMGFVGAGGLGQRIHVAISLFHQQQLLTLILAIYLIVTLVDALSAYLRARLL